MMELQRTSAHDDGVILVVNHSIPANLARRERPGKGLQRGRCPLQGLNAQSCQHFRCSGSCLAAR